MPAIDATNLRHVLVVIPNWVGDVVLATPVLASLRQHLSGARITYLMRSYVDEIVAGAGWHDEVIHWPAGRGLLSLHCLARRLAAASFDAAILLTNSWRSALVTWLAGVPRRLGYDREGRGWLLTDRLRPLRHRGEYLPVPMYPYYAALAAAIGARPDGPQPRLAVSEEQEAAGTALCEHYDLRPGQYAVLNPGAAFGAAKCWLPDRFAEVADRLHDGGLRPVLVGAPREVPLMRDIAGRCAQPVTVCDEPGTTLGSLKVVIREAAALICNDTGPRHYGLALGVPTVTIFGPTHQEWTDTECPHEVKLQARVPCGPCQLKVCPLDLVCMKRVTSDMVIAAVERLTAAGRGDEAARPGRYVGNHSGGSVGG